MYNDNFSPQHVCGDLRTMRFSGVGMEFFDVKKMPVNLWRNGAGETREICCFPPSRDFNWRASIASFASNGDFNVVPQVDRVMTLLDGGEVTLLSGGAFRHTLKRHQPFTFAGEHPVRAELTDGRMSLDFNLMTRRDRCRAQVRVADRTFTTGHARGGIVYVLSGAWQLNDKLLTAEQGAWWQEGSHTLRLLKAEGQVLFSEITYL